MHSNRRIDHLSAEERLARTFFLVEATHNEMQTFWRDNAKTSSWRQKDTTPLDWKEISSGCHVEVGRLNNRPVCISIWWAEIEGKLIAFWEGVSQLLDYVMIEKYLTEHFHGKWDANTRRAVCDASNFHHCIHAIEKANKK